MILARNKKSAEQLSKESLSRPPDNPWVKAWHRLLHNRAATLGLGIILFFILIGIFADVITPYDPIKANFAAVRQAPSLQHLMGTDKQGRDVLSRIIYGTRISMSIGFLSQVLTILVGTILGAIAGYYGGKLDTLIMRITDVFYAFPNLLLLIILMAAFGRGFLNLLVAMTFTAWVGSARLVRGQVLQLKEFEFVESARALGASDRHIILRHMLPNVMSTIMVAFSFGVPGAILGEAGLSFLGIGLVPPTPSWGIMLNDGFAVLRALPNVVFFPALVIAIVMVAFLYLGDGLRDALDPRA